MSPQPEQPTEGALVGLSTLFYGVMSAIGLGLIAAQSTPAHEVIFGDGANGVRHMLLGAGAGLAVVAISWFTRNLPAARRLSDELAGVLGRPGTATIAILAVTSAVGEELLFRGALQPLIGFWPTVLLFGIIHGGTNPKLRTWAIFATLAGILLGWLTESTGNLLAPILCHLTVNYWNLHALTAEPGTPAADG